MFERVGGFYTLAHNAVWFGELEHHGPVAIKHFPICPVFAHAPLWKRDDLEDERRRLEQLNGHPNIVSILGWCDDVHNGDLHYAIVLEWCERGDLWTTVRADAPWSFADMAVVVAGVGRALTFLHSRRSAHGQLCPSHVVQRADGTPKLVDFCVSDNVTYSKYRPDRFFTAPEPHKKYVSGATANVDAYSFAALVAFLLTHQAPTTRHAEHTRALERWMCRPVHAPASPEAGDAWRRCIAQALCARDHPRPSIDEIVDRTLAMAPHGARSTRSHDHTIECT